MRALTPQQGGRDVVCNLETSQTARKPSLDISLTSMPTLCLSADLVLVLKEVTKSQQRAFYALGQMPETYHSEIRFAVIAVQQGFVTRDQLCKALKTQVKDDLKGKPQRLLAEILFEQGSMTRPQMGEVFLPLEQSTDDLTTRRG
jgi:hypothetical protein